MRLINNISNKEIKEFTGLARDSLINYCEVSGGLGYRFFHGLRVMNYCKKLINYDELREKDFIIDEKALLISALFHDVGVISCNNDEINSNFHDNHEVEGSKLIIKLLKDKLDKKTLNKVSKIILEHHSIKPRFVETIIIQDADRLDESGFLNVWRMASYASFMKKSLIDQINYWFNHEEKRLKNKINEFHFEISKVIAEQRFNKNSYFMNEIMKENNGDDFP